MKNNKRKRNQGIPEVKVLMLSLSLVATLGLWNFFSQQDKLALLDSQAAVTLPAESPPGLALDLPPVPTLLAPSAEGQNTAAQPQAAPTVQPLRSVNKPAAQSFFSFAAPKVVGGGGGGGGTTTRTRSS